MFTARYAHRDRPAFVERQRLQPVARHTTGPRHCVMGPDAVVTIPGITDQDIGTGAYHGAGEQATQRAAREVGEERDFVVHRVVTHEPTVVL